MISEERLRDAMAASAIGPSPGFFERLDERAARRERQRRVRAMVAVAAAVAVLAAAVGIGLHERSTTAAASRAKEHFVTQASRICDQAARQGKAEDPFLAVFVTNTKAAWDRVASTDQAAITALRSLVPPPGERVVVASMLAEFDRALGDGLVVVAVGQVADSFSRPFTAALTVADKQAALAAQAARDYGVGSCAQLIYPN